MGYPADFHAAHLRHWRDAELLFEHRRWANADHLYGLSAECGLKALMRRSGMPVGRHGAPTEREHKVHANELWQVFAAFVRGTVAGRHLHLLPAANPFDRWSIGDRYAHDRHFDCTRVRPHRSGADAVRGMVARAWEDGVL